jgi:Bacterial Ig domain
MLARHLRGEFVSKVVFGGALVAALFVLVSPVSAQYPRVADISISDTTLSCPGDEFTITGTGFTPGSTVDIFVDGEQVASMQADEQGEFSVTIDAPDAAAGEHTVTAESSEGDRASATITCVGAAVAFTGADISRGLLLLIALVAVGALALYAGRRRARTAP